jgi:hypothetical protein
MSIIWVLNGYYTGLKNVYFYFCLANYFDCSTVFILYLKWSHPYGVLPPDGSNNVLVPQMGEAANDKLDYQHHHLQHPHMMPPPQHPGEIKLR